MSDDTVVELLTKADFDAAMDRGGVIVISDDANRSGAKRVAHLQRSEKRCSHVDPEDFLEKVRDNANRHGRYWWARNSKLAREVLGAQLCGESERLLNR